MEELEVIQGDTLDASLTIENADAVEISNVTFRCPSLEIEKALYEATEDDDSVWCLKLLSSETIDLRVGRWDFDITAVTSGSDQYTVVHQGSFIVKHKRDRSATITNIISGMGYTED